MCHLLEDISRVKSEGKDMKVKRIFSFYLAVMLLAGLLAGCGSGPKNATAATPLTAEEDARLKEELQADIDAILNTETEIVHADTYIAGETYTGTAYYVSNDGDDNNDGLTPETAWQTISRLAQEAGGWEREGVLKPGDAVFFRRGDIFRDQNFHLGTDGLTFSAYGEGEKPIFTTSSENGSGEKSGSLFTRIIPERKSGSITVICRM